MDLRAKAEKLADEIRVWALPGPRLTKLFNVDGAEQLIYTALSDVYYAALTEASASPAGAAMFQGNAAEVVNCADVWTLENPSPLYRVTISKIEQPEG